MRRITKVKRKLPRTGAKKRRALRAWLRAARNGARFFLLLVVSFLISGSVMPYLNIGGVTPSLLFAVVGVITVCYGRLRAYWAGAIFGILAEISSPAVTMLNLLLYPLAAMFCAIFFADKSDKRLETERSLNKAARNGNVYVRSVLCAGMNTLLYEIVNVTYIYLRGTAVTAQHISRSLIDIVCTMILCLLLAPLLRKFLGFKVVVREESSSMGRYVS